MPGALCSVDLLHAYSKQSDKRDVAAQLASAAAQHRRSPATRSTAKPARRLREAEIDDLVTSYETTRSVNAVARQFRISRQTVAKHLASRGIETVRRMTAADLATAVEHTFKEIPQRRSAGGSASILRPSSTDSGLSAPQSGHETGSSR